MRRLFTNIVFGLATAIVTLSQSPNESPNACDYHQGDRCDEPPLWTWQCCADGTWAGCVRDWTIEYMECPPGQGCVYLAGGEGFTSCNLDDGCDVASGLPCKPFRDGGIGCCDPE